MTQLNPLAGAIAGGFQQQHVLEVDKQRQLRRARTLEQNVAAEDEQLEHEVESSDQIRPIHDEAEDRQRQPRQDPADHEKTDDDDEAEEHPHIDVRG